VNCSAAVETAASYSNCWLVTVRHDNGYGRSVWACFGFTVTTNAPRQILNYSSSSALDAASRYAAVFDGAMPETVSIESLNYAPYASAELTISGATRGRATCIRAKTASSRSSPLYDSGLSRPIEYLLCPDRCSIARMHLSRNSLRP
jgi:hypothetical protein